MCWENWSGNGTAALVKEGRRHRHPHRQQHLTRARRSSMAARCSAPAMAAPPDGSAAAGSSSAAERLSSSTVAWTIHRPPRRSAAPEISSNGQQHTHLEPRREPHGAPPRWEQGSLLVTGTVASSPITVASGATLAGPGPPPALPCKAAAHWPPAWPGEHWHAHHGQSFARRDAGRGHRQCGQCGSRGQHGQCHAERRSRARRHRRACRWARPSCW